MNTPADNVQRIAALDPLRSICVTAPAGSGKTELLSQRVLKLLATADRPEEILAITFTRKAAAEMHHRIIQSLRNAVSGISPDEPHKILSWTLACEALARDKQCGWNLLDNTSRLKIQTIDSLCASLTRQMPILANFGAQPKICQDAAHHYALAVSQFFELLEQDSPLADDLAELLLHVDNDLPKAERLLIMLLQRRDQWLLHIGIDGDPQSAKQQLENTLQSVCLDVLKQLHHKLVKYSPELLPLIDYAACNLQWQKTDSIVTQLAGIMELPEVNVDTIEQWQAIAEVLLKKNDDWRKTVNKNNGFPTETEDGDKVLAKQLKENFLSLLSTLQDNDDLLQLLIQLRNLPAPSFNEQQWQLLQSLTRLLPRLVAQLHVVFQQCGEVDYNQISMAALRALGDGMNPTELAMKLDHQLCHILVDEFQDTASTQFKLLERLMEGWVEHNTNNPLRPNTLFIVGDGMQSIYGFREANVSLFLQARKQGVNGVVLDDLPLTVNFRSDPPIVSWINHTFKQAFPAVENLSRGAVPFEEAVAFNSNNLNCDINVSGFTGQHSRSQEADHTVTLVQQSMQQNPDGSIAILVRSRGHLKDIIPALSAAGITWSATDIDPLAGYGSIIDLLSLTKALFNIGDRISWAALLRSPWFGLTNNDIHRLLSGNEYRSVLSLLNDVSLISQLSRHARQKLPKLTKVLNSAMYNKSRFTARSWVEGVWLAIGGAASTISQEEFSIVDDYFDLLESHQLGESIASMELFEIAIDKLYAAPSVQNGNVQIMTIHKAKGLEFDTVILPAMARSLRSEDKSLLMWREYLSPLDNVSGLLISPLGATDQDEDSVYKYLRYEQSQTNSLENTRLFYVAATRAINHLYISFTSDIDSKTGEAKPPTKNCLLYSAWETIKDEVNWVTSINTEIEQFGLNFNQSTPNTELSRLDQSWNSPKWSFNNPLADYYLSADINNTDNTPELSIDPLPSCIGTVVHWILEILVEKGTNYWSTMEEGHRNNWIDSLLHCHDLSSYYWSTAKEQITSAIFNIINDKKGKWLLSNTHQQSTTELSVLSTMTGGVKQRVIDRVFIDKKQGICWIIDYKTSTPQDGESKENFINREIELYQSQLLDYRDHLSQLYQQDLPIKIALYFTYYPHWQEIE
jgi:ATP-dependent exoDNAse (exonuclease V) beta subunit